MIAITVSDATRAGAESAATKLRALGHHVRLFEADGRGLVMERLIRCGEVKAVLDLTLTELLTHCNPDRLTAAGLMGIPQVIVPGGLDAEQSPELLDAIGKEIAEKASAAKGPTRIVLPRRGVSGAAPNNAMRAFFQAIRNWICPSQLLIEADLDINNAEFVDLLIVSLIAMMS